MSKHLWIAFTVLLGVQQSARALEIPLHPDVASRIARIATGEAAEELKKAIAEYEANKKSSK